MSSGPEGVSEAFQDTHLLRGLRMAGLTLAAMTSVCTAQITMPGTLTGIVLDPSGARIPHASIRITRDAFQQNLITNDTGGFVASLPPGIYQVQVGAPGFATATRGDLALPEGGKISFTVRLVVQAASEEVTVPPDAQASTSARDNKSALIFGEKQLAGLSDDDATLQKQLLALAGAGGQRQPQVYVDGFSGGRFPPKNQIAQVRINQDPYSAQYGEYGSGRLEVFTKPGTGELHGSLSSSGTDAPFNAQNPYTSFQPPYHSLKVTGDLSGPLDRKTSAFASGYYLDAANNTVVNAVIVNPGFGLTPLSQAVRDPQITGDDSLRLDRQLSANDTFVAKYEYNQNRSTNAGVGLLVLASEGTNNTTTTQTLQLSNTQIMTSKVIDETRFQYIRTRLEQTVADASPTIVVQGSFNGGGASVGDVRDAQDRYEFQDYFSFEKKKHYLRAGVRYRLLREANSSTANYNGQYIFPDLATYQTTLQGVAEGLSGAQIRAEGGGATQFNLTAGQTSATLLTGDVGIYVDDEWKLTKNVTANYGLRIESQSAIPDQFDPAPRLGFAWAVHQGEKKPAWAVLRGGFGLFYDRFSSGNILTSIRQNGVSQQTYYVQNPNFFPNSPAPASLGMGTAPTIYRIAPSLRSQYSIIGGLTAEHQFGRWGSVSASWIQLHNVHQFISRNINAPLPGTYDPANPASAVRPLGGNSDLYQFSSDANGNDAGLVVNTSLSPTKWMQVFAYYTAEHQRSETSGAAAFPSNQYDLRQDYGRSQQPGQTYFVEVTMQLPFGITVDPFINGGSGIPFDVTIGQDLNGDTIYNDRPAFATDLTRASVMRTAYGNFDTSPIAGQKLVPVNYATGPSSIFVQLSVEKSFKVGPRPGVSSAVSAPGKGPAPRPDRPYNLSFSVVSANVLNHVNPGIPIGVLDSPLFGKSISLNTGQLTNAAANRTVFLHSSFNF